MKEIIDRLQENRNIERAKSILESHGYKVTKSISEEENPRRSSGNWEEEMKTKAFPVGEDQINSFKKYLRSKGFKPFNKEYYVNDSTGDKVYIYKTWYGNYHAEPIIK